MFNILHIPSNILSIFAATFWFLIVVYPCAASDFVAFANLLVIVAMCATSPASCMSSTTTGSGDATPAPNTPVDNNDEDDEDYH